MTTFIVNDTSKILEDKHKEPYMKMRKDNIQNNNNSIISNYDNN